MATLTQRNGIYYADFFDATRKPQRKRHSLKTRNKTTARQLIVRLEDAYRTGAFDPWVQSPAAALSDRAPDIYISDAVREFLDYKRGRNIRDTSLSFYERHLRALVRHTGNAALARISREDCEGYILEPGRKKTTHRNRYMVAKMFFTWSVDNSKLKTNPLRDMPVPRIVDVAPRAITEDELERMIAVLEADYHAKRNRQYPIPEGTVIFWREVWRFAFVTGLRASELGRLRWRDVDEQNRLLYISAEQKNRRAQTIPLSQRALEILQTVGRRADDEYVFCNPIIRHRTRNIEHWVTLASKRFCYYRRLAGLGDNITLHSTRHGFCTKLAKSGKNAYVIMAAARHANLTTSQRYVSLANRDLLREIDSVFS